MEDDKRNEAGVLPDKGSFKTEGGYFKSAYLDGGVVETVLRGPGGVPALTIEGRVLRRGDVFLRGGAVELRGWKLGGRLILRNADLLGVRGLSLDGCDVGYLTEFSVSVSGWEGANGVLPSCHEDAQEWGLWIEVNGGGCGVGDAFPGEGEEFTAWKACKSVDGSEAALMELRVPGWARRCSLTGDWGRCEAAEVASIRTVGGAELEEALSLRLPFAREGKVYRVGETIRADGYDGRWWRKSGAGVSFLMTREWALSKARHAATMLGHSNLFVPPMR